MVIRRLRGASCAALCLALVVGAMTPSRAQNAPNTEPNPTPSKPVAQSISADALRLLLSFSQFLPVAGQPSGARNNVISNEDRFLHARLQGRRLGNFDLYYDLAATEQIWAGQLRTVESTGYFDVWTAFALNRAAQRPQVGNTVTGEVGGPDAISCSSYQIKTEIKPPTRLDVQASLEMEVRQGGQRALLFELSRFLQIKQVEANGHA